MDVEGRRKSRKACYHSSRALCLVDIGECGTTANMFKKCRRSCVDHLRVPTSHGMFQPSRLDDEQPSGPAETTIPPPPPPPPHPPLRPPDVTHVMNDTRPSAFFAALPHPCIIFNGNQRTEINWVGLRTWLGIHPIYLQEVM